MGVTRLTVHVSRVMLFIAIGLLIVGCSQEKAAAPPAPEHVQSGPVGFVNKVWQVDTSTSVASGSIYVFVTDGTLLMTSPHSKPSLGTWKYEDGALTMVEEGIPYPVDILELSADRFRIRSNNPGTAVEITLVPAAVEPLPK